MVTWLIVLLTPGRERSLLREPALPREWTQPRDGGDALWNAVYLERAVAALRQQQPVRESPLRHLASLGWNHINLTGD